MIRKIGKEWVLYNHDGTKILGKHKTKNKAIAQEIAVNISKQRETK